MKMRDFSCEELKSLAVELPDEVSRYEAAGDFEGAGKTIDRWLEKPVGEAMKTRLRYEKYIIQELPKEFPDTEEEVIRVRRKAGKAVQAVFRQLGLSPISDEQVEAVTYAHGSKDTLPRDVTADLMAAEDVLKRGITGVDIVKALAETGYEDLAESVLNMLKQRVVGDYMQTSAILDRDFHVLSGVNTPNDYMGPGTGYRVEGERWDEIKRIPHIINPQDI